ncbi:MAG: S24/S26 family peptidase [Acidobacteriota bacterium]|nr:S24/S26 family peptidase [Blastocatellia bacterium]MDW8411700.1 S24/S26 family peptidase [Acidobacteriota bacterium]
MQTYSKLRVRLGLNTPNILEIARHELSKKRPLRIQACGTSMQPSINDGDYLLVEPCHPSEVRRGDVVLVETSRATALIRRVVKIEQRNGINTFIVRADAASIYDLPVPFSHFVGKVTSIEKNGSKLDLDKPLTKIRLYLAGLIQKMMKIFKTP